MPRPSKFTEEQKETIRKLHFEADVPYRDLALQYEVSFNTILRICEPETYKKHLAASKEYQKVNIKAIAAQRANSLRKFSLALSKQNDSDIIEYLEGKDNVSQYLRDLVYNDMVDSKKTDKVD